MVTLDKIRTDMQGYQQNDKDMVFVEVNADTLEEALSDASIQLDTKINNVEYEVISKGSDGFLGFAKKPWTIKAFQTAASLAKKRAKQAKTEEVSSELEGEGKVIIRDGLFYVRRFPTGIFLKVVEPVGAGKPVDYDDVINEVRRDDTENFDEKSIKKFVKETTAGKYEYVGEYKHEPAGDSTVVVDVSKDEMDATITVSAPLLGGAEVTPEMIQATLKTQGISVGISEEKISEFIDNPIYASPYIVAQGPRPQDGHDAYIQYNFETDRSKLRIQETKSGNMNFKELNQIQNVVAGQVLAKKIEAERGHAGKTLFGKYLEASNGKDIPLPLGKNVELDKDGLTILATENGQVMLIGDKINVEPVYEVDSVSIKTGNIDFLGTVIVKGNVEDGFDVHASGNVEVYGTVGKSNIEAEGDVIVSQGIMGRDEGTIYAGKSVWAKFIQNTKVGAGEFVVVNDSIMNSDVTAKKKILLRGKRAQITGGHLFATEEIVAKNIGSAAGSTETILEVGFDPEAKMRVNTLQETLDARIKELDDIELNIATLENQRKMRRALSKEKEDSLNALMQRKAEIAEESTSMTQEIEDINQRLRELKVVGKVSASGMVYPGVKIVIRDERDELKTEVKSVTFYYEGGFVRRGKYEAPDLEGVEMPDGYSAN